MADKPVLKISPDLFRWARTSVGLPLVVAAKRIGVKPDKLEEWEGEQAFPTPRQLEKAADAYKRPVATFFLPEPPEEPPLPIDFRTPALTTRNFSTPTRLAIRRARWLKEVYAEIGENRRANIPHQTDSRPESLAAVIQGWLPKTLSAVRGRQPDDALRVWRQSLEDDGLLVFQFSLPAADAHAFSLADDVPTIVLNSRDSYSRRIFSIVHELAHLILRQPGLCSPSEYVDLDGSNQIEMRCNAAAALALVPDGDLAEQTPVARLRRGGDISEALEPLARAFAVSREVILRRLFDLEIVSRQGFRRTIELLRREFEEKQKLKKKRKIIVQPSTKAVSQLGRNFVTNVLSAHERGAISDSDVAEYLGVRLHHVDKIQELVGTD
ncbi:MAG TPA: ImmA/IrrE family metallo-endopeptidase [Terriglobales bacterium]|nr:ImmA/IrrE family metallo-endopeptidase [Terriglobales bacterium]